MHAKGGGFPHAFDPLSRIFRESTDDGARAAALRAIARIDTAESAELLLAVLEHEGSRERSVAVAALKRSRGNMFPEAARRALPNLTGGAKRAVRDVLKARGEAV